MISSRSENQGMSALSIWRHRFRQSLGKIAWSSSEAHLIQSQTFRVRHKDARTHLPWIRKK
jgi:hypothetical protein